MLLILRFYSVPQVCAVRGEELVFGRIGLGNRMEWSDPCALKRSVCLFRGLLCKGLLLCVMSLHLCIYNSISVLPFACLTLRGLFGVWLVSCFFQPVSVRMRADHYLSCRPASIQSIASGMYCVCVSVCLFGCCLFVCLLLRMSLYV